MIQDPQPSDRQHSSREPAKRATSKRLARLGSMGSARAGGEIINSRCRMAADTPWPPWYPQRRSGCRLHAGPQQLLDSPRRCHCGRSKPGLTVVAGAQRSGSKSTWPNVARVRRAEPLALAAETRALGTDAAHAAGCPCQCPQTGRPRCCSAAKGLPGPWTCRPCPVDAVGRRARTRGCILRQSHGRYAEELFARRPANSSTSRSCSAVESRFGRRLRRCCGERRRAMLSCASRFVPAATRSHRCTAAKHRVQLGIPAVRRS
jgi:hypothetical protein